MALHEPVHHHHGSKTLGEGAICFACAIGALGLAAVAIQWVMGIF